MPSGSQGCHPRRPAHRLSFILLPGSVVLIEGLRFSTESWILIHDPGVSGELGIQPATPLPHTGAPWKPAAVCENFTQMVRVAAVASWMSFQINSPSCLWCENLSPRLLGRMHVYRWTHPSRVKWKREGRRSPVSSLKSLAKAECKGGFCMHSLRQLRKPYRTQRRLRKDFRNWLHNIK